MDADLLQVAIGAGGGLVGLLVGILTGRWSKRGSTVLVTGVTTSSGTQLKVVGGKIPPHEHTYGVMRGDGKGWRCTICDRPRPPQ